MVSVRSRPRCWGAYATIGIAIPTLGFASIAAGVPFAHGARSPSYCFSEATVQCPTSQKEPEKPFWEKAETDPVAAFTGALAALTAGLVAVSGIQIFFLTRADRATRVALDQSRDAAIRELRAYVAPISGSIFSDGLLVQAQMTLENVGKTPATDLVCFCSIRIGDWPQTSFVRPSSTEGKLPIKRELWPSQKLFEDPVTLEVMGVEMTAIRAEEKAFFVEGVVEYIDVFGWTVRTYYSRYWNGWENLSKAPALRISPHGNETSYTPPNIAA
jgi:hypothetical protein